MRVLVGLSLLGLACGGPPGPEDDPLTQGEPFRIIKTTLSNAQLGTQYEVVLTAQGGTEQVVDWRIQGGLLPPGLEIIGEGISKTQTLIRGVPRAVGSYDFTVLATDARSTRDFARFTLNVLPDPPNPIVEADLSSGRVGEFFVARFEATGVVSADYEWRLNSGESTLPEGLEWSPGSPTAEQAEIRGEPEEGGIYPFEVQVLTGTGFDTLRGELDIRYPPLRFDQQDLPAAVRGEAYLTTIRVEGGAGRGIQWSLGSAPPNGLRLDVDAAGASTTLTGTPSNEGLISFEVIAYDPVSGDRASQTFAIEIFEGRPPLKILTSVLTAAAVHTPYDESLQASGGTPPYEWSVRSDLPPGLGLFDGRIVGTPEREASVDVELEVIDRAGLQSARTVRLEIGPPELAIVSDVLPDGQVDALYTAAILTLNGPDFGLLWFEGSGEIPPGLGLRANSSPDGVLFGTPLQAGTFQFRVVALDPAMNRTDSQELLLTIRP